MGIYLVTSAVLLALLGLAWKSSDFFNVSIKIFVLVLAGFGIFYSMRFYGYVVKAEGIVEGAVNNADVVKTVRDAGERIE